MILTRSRLAERKLNGGWHIISVSFPHIRSSKSGTIAAKVRFRRIAAHSDSRQPGQGGDADTQVRDLRAELLRAEAAHVAKVKGIPQDQSEESQESTISSKRQLENGDAGGGDAGEDLEVKRRRILEETRDIDADSDGSADDSSTDER